MSYIAIYFGDKPVFLCDQLTAEIDEFRHHPDAIYIDELSTAAIKSLFHEIKRDDFHAGIIQHENFEKLKKTFFKFFKLVQTGGGVVAKRSGEVLVMCRRGKWDLPKGKLDKGETLTECAVREVKEETGLKEVTLGQFIKITYHTYEEYGKQILKESHWYQMQVKGDETLVPQTEEDITQLIWVKKENLPEYYKGTFPTIRSIFETLQ